LTERGIVVKFVKEGLTFTNDEKAMSKLLLSVRRAFDEFERSLITERQRECIARAKRSDVHTGLKSSLGPELVAELRTRVAAGEKRAALAREFRISRRTLYDYAPVAALPSVISRLQIQQRHGNGPETPGVDT
jgi:DNA invertase Pin-like site-specific DNA recombinase